MERESHFARGFPPDISLKVYGKPDGDVSWAQIMQGEKSVGRFEFKHDAEDPQLEYLYFDPDLQGKGLAKPLLRNMVDMAKADGAGRISLLANIDVGAYAWAKYGFVPDKDSWNEIRGKMRKDMLELCKFHNEDDRRAVELMLNSSDPRAIWELADSLIMFTSRSGSERRIGQFLLKSQKWKGSLDFADKDSMERFSRYTRESK